jgi:hypothetical protein
MGGLPRSGSTLLTILLNQHPDIYSSHNTELITAINDMKLMMLNYEPIKIGLLNENYYSVYKNMPFQFYENVKKPVVIDKNRRWGQPFSIDIAKEFTEDIKIIYPYRPILEILASFIRLTHSNPGKNFIDKEISNSDFFPKYYRSDDDTRCEWLMQPGSIIDKSLLALGNALKKENKHMFHIVYYDDLVNKTQESLSSIYNFLQVDDYKHNLNLLPEYSNKLDKDYFGFENMHKVRNTISNESIAPEKILSKYIINKYKDATISMGMER